MADRLLRALRTIPDFPRPGIQFKDISPVLADPGLLSEALEHLMAPWKDDGIELVIGIESRGFLFGAMLAERLGAGFAMARKPGKLPAATVAESYALEYGSDTVELHADAVRPGARVLIHDDVIATGGTAAAAGQLVRRLDGVLAGYSFLIELEELAGRKLLPADTHISTVIRI